MCWAIPFGQRINAQVRWSRPDEDPPDVDFHIRRRDGTEMTVWGEVTGAYYNSKEAKWLWGAALEMGKEVDIGNPMRSWESKPESWSKASARSIWNWHRVMSRHLLKVSDGSSLLRRHSPSRQVLHLVL